ncbi:MAG: LysE family transporter [Treponema sp.]|nr:LysE family transporter [Treponema sp.]
MFNWVAFLIYIFLMSFTPGPNNIMSMNNGVQRGFRKGLIFNLGIWVGIFWAMILCLAASAFLYTLIPRIQFPMKIAGAGYMMYLILITILPAQDHAVRDVKASFLWGMILQFINPKLYIYGITSMSSYILPFYGNLFILIGFSLILASMGFAGTIAWSLFGSLFSRLFKEHDRIVKVVMVLLLVYCAVSLFL